MMYFCLLSAIAGGVNWYITGDEMGFAIGVCLFWCGAAGMSICGLDKKVKVNGG